MRIFPYRFHREWKVAPTPIGVICPYCRQAIESGQLGFLVAHVDEPGRLGFERGWHRMCFLRSIGLCQPELDRQTELEAYVVAKWRETGAWPTG
jgi:hypothetical protein